MDNREVAEVFDDISQLLEAKGENPFKVRAYRNAARAIAHHPTELRELVAAGSNLRDIPGVGDAIAGKAIELVTTGRLQFYERLKEEMPRGILELLSVPGVGPKKAARLSEELGVNSVAELEHAIVTGQVAALPGMGRKTAEALLRTIHASRTRDARLPITDVLPVVEEILIGLRSTPGVERIEVAGSVRRFCDTVGDVHILGTAERPADVIARFVELGLARQVLARGDTKATVLTDTGLQVDLRMVPTGQFGSLLQYFTGSREHNIALREYARRKGLSLSEYGITDVATGAITPYADEVAFYARLGMQYIPPEMRENRGEIQLALKTRLPGVLDEGDIRGDLHLHSTWSDGQASILEMASAARDRGYEYIAITDHSIGLGMIQGMDGAKLRSQREEIGAAQRQLEGIRILAGVEANILADGALDLPDEDLEPLDVVVAGVHTGLNQPEEKMTPRVLRALANPHVDIVAHPSGRLLGRREATSLDIGAVIRAARDNGKMLEINAMLDRLDLTDRTAAAAREAGVLLALGTDAHAPYHLDYMTYGVRLARRAWCTAADVANSLPVARLLERLHTQ